MNENSNSTALVPVNQETIRDDKGRFTKGHSGNPAGKPVGTLDYQTRFFNEFIVHPMFKSGEISDKDKFQLIIERLATLAKDGNINAIRLILEYLLPKQKNEVELSGGIGVVTYEDVLKMLRGKKNESETAIQPKQSNQ